VCHVFSLHNLPPWVAVCLWHVPCFITYRFADENEGLFTVCGEPMCWIWLAVVSIAAGSATLSAETCWDARQKWATAAFADMQHGEYSAVSSYRTFCVELAYLYTSLSVMWSQNQKSSAPIWHSLWYPDSADAQMAKQVFSLLHCSNLLLQTGSCNGICHKYPAAL